MAQCLSILHSQSRRLFWQSYTSHKPLKMSCQNEWVNKRLDFSCRRPISLGVREHYANMGSLEVLSRTRQETLISGKARTALVESVQGEPQVHADI